MGQHGRLFLFGWGFFEFSGEYDLLGVPLFSCIFLELLAFLGVSRWISDIVLSWWCLEGSSHLLGIWFRFAFCHACSSLLARSWYLGYDVSLSEACLLFIDLISGEYDLLGAPLFLELLVLLGVLHWTSDIVMSRWCLESSSHLLGIWFGFTFCPACCSLLESSSHLGYDVPLSESWLHLIGPFSASSTVIS